MELQHVGLQRLHDGVERRIVGIDAERDLAGAPFDARGKLACHVECEMARRRRKEHEADEVGSRRERRIERVGRAEAANLHQDGHEAGSSGCRAGF